MNDEEKFIKEMRGDLCQGYRISQDAQDHLIALARRGAELKPRPISEAHKDGTWYLGWEEGHSDTAKPILWSVNLNEWLALPHGELFEDFTMTHCVPLSAITDLNK